MLTRSLTALSALVMMLLAMLTFNVGSAAAHYGHYCGNGSHTYYQDGNTWRESLIRDEGTRHTYRVTYWYDAPWWDYRGDRWLLNGDVYRICYNGWV